MKDIICSGCSHTSYRTLMPQMVLDGFIPDIDSTNDGTFSYPEAINHLYGNKVYNLGMANNSIPAAVLSVISKAQKLIDNGNKNFAIIFQCTDFLRESIYIDNEYRQLKKLRKSSQLLINNYLFNDYHTGFWQFGGFQNFNQNLFACENTAKIGKLYGEYIFSENGSTIKSITHLLLLQNFCKVNNIPYKIFFMMDLISEGGINFIKPFSENPIKKFDDYFVKKQLNKPERFKLIQKDEYVYDLFKMLDLNNFWFYKDTTGGVFEWLYTDGNEYTKGDDEYIGLLIEDIQQFYKLEKGQIKNTIYKIPITHAIENIKNYNFNFSGHITYYYWKKFVREIMIHWGFF